jgi:hypothetical protein
LEVGAAGDGDNRDHSFSALGTARYLIHDVLPFFIANKEQELLFHWSDMPSSLGAVVGSSAGKFGHAAIQAWNFRR